MNPGRRLAVLNILLLIGGGILWSAGPDHMASLKGITGVNVKFERVSEDARYDGLDPTSIQGDTEQLLKKAGIKLLTAPEALAEPGSPTLYVRINAKIPWNSSDYSVNTTVALLQDAVSARDASVKLRQAKTWDAGYLTVIARADMRQVRNIVRDLINEFVKDWQTANGK